MKGTVLILLLLMCYIIGDSFTMIDNVKWDPYPLYPLENDEDKIDSWFYMYYLSVHLKELILLGIIFYYAKEYRNEISIFIMFSVLGLVDYVLRYNVPFFYIESLKINLDLVAICIESLVLGLVMIKGCMQGIVKNF